MTAMLSGLVLVAAFGLTALAALVLVVALYRVSGHPAAGAASDLGQNGDLNQTGAEGS
jgi:hypothetical protein